MERHTKRTLPAWTKGILPFVHPPWTKGILPFVQPLWTKGILPFVHHPPIRVPFAIRYALGYSAARSVGSMETILKVRTRPDGVA